MFPKIFLNKLKLKRKLKFNIDEKLRIGRELGNIIDFRTKHTEYRWTAIYEYFKSINHYKATIDEVTEYFLFGHFTRYEIVILPHRILSHLECLKTFQRILIVLFILWKPLIVR